MLDIVLTMVLHELVALLINLIHLLSNINLGSTTSAIYGTLYNVSSVECARLQDLLIKASTILAK